MANVKCEYCEDCLPQWKMQFCLLVEFAYKEKNIPQDFDPIRYFCCIDCLVVWADAIQVQGHIGNLVLPQKEAR